MSNRMKLWYLVENQGVERLALAVGCLADASCFPLSFEVLSLEVMSFEASSLEALSSEASSPQ